MIFLQSKKIKRSQTKPDFVHPAKLLILLSDSTVNVFLFIRKTQAFLRTGDDVAALNKCFWKPLDERFYFCPKSLWQGPKTIFFI